MSTCAPKLNALLSLLQFIDFKVILPENMLTFNLNSLNDIKFKKVKNNTNTNNAIFNVVQ